ncbi:MAG: hypothetical protein E2P01_06365 [Acidobacteria bacterium]|nr:MAG: hypothetical protein E2P01_06365 [Acidobacteriota bacterium]
MDRKAMTRNVVTAALAMVWITACVAPSAVQRYFAQAEHSYPLQINAPSRDGPKLVCPGCDEAERPAPEHEGLLRSGLEFVRTGLSVEYLRNLTDADAEAFLISDAYLFESSPGGEITLLVDLSTFKLATSDDGEIHMPHERHPTVAGEVLELRNLLLLRRTEEGWEYSSWVY